MKKLFYTLILLFFAAVSKAQSVGIGTTTPDPSALLHLQSSTKGFLVPAMATTDREAIASPAAGLLVYDYTSKSFWLFTSAAWHELVTDATSLWSRNGVDIYNNSNRVGIGTTLPNANAQLEIKGTNKGLLIPRGNAATRTALNSNTAKGLLVCDTTTNTIWIHNGNGLASGWQSLSVGTNYWQQAGAAGNEIQNSNAGGFWSANPTVVTTDPASFTTPVSGAGTRMMWLPAKSAFRVGTLKDNISTPLDNEGNAWDTDSIGLYSFAAGNNAKALGYNSISMGFQTNAIGGASMAFGTYSAAEGSGAVTIGGGNLSRGNEAFCLGKYNEAVAEGAFAIGSYNRAKGINSTAIGEQNIANGVNSIALGQYTRTNGYASTGFGREAIATGTYSMAGNYATSASGDVASSFGRFTVARSFASLAIGQYNDSIASSNTGSWVTTDPLFILGNGSSTNSRSNALVVYKNGNTDINGYTQLGEVAPAIKIKKLTVNTPSVQGAFNFVAHGLTQSKIISITGLATIPGGFQIIPGQEQAGYKYTVNSDNGNIAVGTVVGSSGSILNMPVTIVITYEE